LKICQSEYALRYATVFSVCFTAEKNSARLTGADHLAGGYVDEMFVLRMHFQTAQFATLHRSALLYESAQNGEGRLWIGDCGLRIADLKIIRSVIV
jgi:hypothetical protein